MAKIPVEKESSGTPVWAWILGLLVLVALTWLTVSLLNNDETAADIEPDVSEQVEAPAPDTDAAAPAAGGTFTSLAAIINADSDEALAGREVDLSNAYVTRVVGDSVFYVASSEGAGNERLPVALDEVVPHQPEGVEGRYHIQEGQTIEIAGTLRTLDQPMAEVWGITGEEAEAIQNHDLYIRAQRLNIIEEINS